jgi:hypothetical protein
MRKFFASAVALSMMAAPAFAQQSNQQQGSQKPPQQSGGQQGQQTQAASQAEVQKALQQAGFKDIQILDSAYLVRAQTKNNETVFMMIDPPASTAMSGSNSQGGSGGSGSGGASPQQGKSSQ